MIFVEDIAQPEGPVVLPDGSWLVVEMAPQRGCITHISADGKNKRVIAKTGRPNGLCVDKDGNIWCAESEVPSLLRVTMDGQVEKLLTECDGKPFLFPNDLCFGPEGALYLTDSGILFEDFIIDGKLHPDYENLNYDGCVYRIDLPSMKIEQIDSGIRFTNGIAFGPDNYLYVNESISGMVYRYRWENGAIVGGREDFGNVNDPALEGFKGPDGMAFGKDGNLYCTVYGQQDVTVLDPKGGVLRRIKTKGKNPTNVAFGLPGDQKIYVTEVECGTLEAIEVGVEGMPLYT